MNQIVSLYISVKLDWKIFNKNDDKTFVEMESDNFEVYLNIIIDKTKGKRKSKLNFFFILIVGLND